MTKSDGMDKEDKLILSRAEDAVRFAERNYCVKAIGFLNPRERDLVSKNISAPAEVKTSFDGGYADAERTMFVCCPEYAETDTDDILSVIRIFGRELEGLTHRDYLGSLMGLGITRENVGDILVTEDGAFVFVKCEIADYIVNNLDKIGRHGIKTELCRCADADIPKPRFREINGTVSSMRLDAVAALCAGVSRAKAAELICQGLVSLNFEVAESVSARVSEGDLISVRGFGRTRLERTGGTTRKGRIAVTLLRYE